MANDAEHLLEEIKTLHAQRAQWAPLSPLRYSPKTPRSLSLDVTTVPEFSAPPLPCAGPVSLEGGRRQLPYNCAKRQFEASLHGRRAAEAERKERQADASVASTRQRQADASAAAIEAIRKARERKVQAERSLKQLAEERATAESESKRFFEEQANRHEEEMASLEKQIVDTRQAAEDQVREVRDSVAWQAQRAALEIEQLRKEFAEKKAALEKELQDYDEKAALAIRDAEQRAHDAKTAAAISWRACRERMNRAHAAADTEVENQHALCDQAIGGTNTELQGLDEALSDELARQKAREEAAAFNDEPQLRLRQVQVAAADAVRSRRRASAELAQKCQEDIAGMIRVAEAAAKETTERALAAQRRAGEGVEALRVDLEAFERERHMGVVLGAHWSLNDQFQSLRKEVLGQVGSFQEEATTQAKGIELAIDATEQRVKALWESLATHRQLQVRSADDVVKAQRDEWEKIVDSHRAHTAQAQAQMVQFVKQQHAAMDKRLRSSGGDQ